MTDSATTTPSSAGKRFVRTLQSWIDPDPWDPNNYVHIPPNLGMLLLLLIVIAMAALHTQKHSSAARDARDDHAIAERCLLTDLRL
jgi:hypothetical protein